LDTCNGGGFLSSETPLIEDLESLQNIAILAAAPEGELASSSADGTGYFTNALLPLLTKERSFEELVQLLDGYRGAKTGNFRDFGFGTVDVSLFAYASPDFDQSLPLGGRTVPEPSGAFFAAFFVVLLVTKRTFVNRLLVTTSNPVDWPKDVR
jgi:hypothetical protein